MPSPRPKAVTQTTHDMGRLQIQLSGSSRSSIQLSVPRPPPLPPSQTPDAAAQHPAPA